MLLRYRSQAREALRSQGSQPAVKLRAAERELAGSGARGTFGVTLACLVLLPTFLWSYWPTLERLVARWSAEPDYSHGFLVVPFAVFLLWLRRADFPAGALRTSAFGLALIAASLVMRLLGGLYFVTALDGWSIPLWVAGCVWLAGGFALLRWSWPSIAFLFFMIPLPFRVERWLNEPLQLVATEVSGFALQCLGHPALTEGHLILLGDERLEVAEACSGLRIFMGIFALACAYVFALRPCWWERLLILASAVPIALLANAARIVATGLLLQHVSTDAAKMFAHDLAGWLMIPLAAALFALVLGYLGRLVYDARVVDVGQVIQGEKVGRPARLACRNSRPGSRFDRRRRRRGGRARVSSVGGSFH